MLPLQFQTKKRTLRELMSTLIPSNEHVQSNSEGLFCALHCEAGAMARVTAPVL